MPPVFILICASGLSCIDILIINRHSNILPSLGGLHCVTLLIPQTITTSQNPTRELRARLPRRIIHLSMPLCKRVNHGRVYVTVCFDEQSLVGMQVGPIIRLVEIGIERCTSAIIRVVVLYSLVCSHHRVDAVPGVADTFSEFCLTLDA